MSYITDTQAIIDFLNRKASDGFMSEPVPHRFIPNYEVQKVAFTDEDKAIVRKYLGLYHSVLSRVDYPSGFLDEHRSASLASMLQFMLTDSDAEYVSANAARLATALNTHREEFVNLEFEREIT